MMAAPATERTAEPLPLALRLKNGTSLIDQQLSAGQLSLRSLIGRSGVIVRRCPTDWPPEVWTNLNYPRDMERWISTAF